MTAPAEDRPDADEVRRVAALARLRPDDAEVERWRDELGAILAHVRTLGALDLDDVEPLAHPRDEMIVLRDDEPGPTIEVGTLLDAAPRRLDDFYEVPRVIEGA